MYETMSGEGASASETHLHRGDPGVPRVEADNRRCLVARSRGVLADGEEGVRLADGC